jgi:hypothetical protein
MVVALRLVERKMVDVQRNVSSELSHFVSARTKTEKEQQYQLLLHILKTGWLLHAPFDPTRPRTASLDFSRPTMAVFGAPVAFEDAPLRACRTALSIPQS